MGLSTWGCRQEVEKSGIPMVIPPIAIYSNPMKNCDFPMNNGDFPMKNGDDQ